MLKFLKDPVQRGWTFLAVAGLVAVLLLAPVVVNADGRHLSAYAEGDEEAGLARTALEGRASQVEAYLSTPHQLADVSEPAKTLLVILGPERRYAEGETQAILDFLQDGGHVLLADEGGYGTDIAREVGFGFVGETVLDTKNHLGDPTLVVADVTADRDYRVLFNAPTALQPLSNAGAYEVLAQTSSAEYPDGSYLDRNRNDEIDIADTAGPFPLVVRTQYGAGTLVLVADTGLFMDAQVKLIDYENDDLIAALAASMVPADGLVLVDEARHAPGPLLAAYDNGVRALGRLTAGSVAPLVTLAVLALATFAAWRFTRETEDWSHHEHNLGVQVPVPENLRPDHERAQRMARRRISEKFNIPLEQVAAMPADQLLSLTGDRMLAEAAAGTLKSDPAPLFKSFSAPEAAR